MNAEHLDIQTPDGAQVNIDALYKICPSCFTESKGEDGALHHVVDFNKLRSLLGDLAVDDAPESYDFTWVGKREAQREANARINKTLRPCVEESVDWEKTQNLYIEGDNLEILKLLQNAYMGKVKMIYIDPPYNTGSDFVYHDDFKISADEYDENNINEDGERFRRNTDSNGRFHSDWCSMMYSRLMVARTLLSEDGLIFISIDDNEQKNLKNICDEVFGEVNFLGQLTVIVKPEGRRYGVFAKCHEFCLVYSKESDLVITNEISVEGASFQYHDEDGGFNLKGLRNRNVKAFNSLNRPNLRYPFYANIQHPDNNGFFPVTTIANENYIKIEASVIDGLESVWRWGKETAELKKNQLVAYKGPDGNYRIFQKERKLTQTAKTLWNETKFISNKGTKEVADILGKSIFDFPKPVALVKQIIQIGTDEESLILDFFSGSATTAHAVTQLNSEDGGNRKFIMVQLPENTVKDSDAYKAGYKNICEIGKERIRRAGKKIKEENPDAKDLDTGFRVLKCDSSNMKDVYFSPQDYNQTMLFDLLDNIKDDRTDLDLLFDCMLRWGVELSMPIDSSKSVDECTIHNVNDGDLVCCFNGEITDKVIDAIAELHPLRVVFRDSSFKEASQKMNLFELFKQKCNWSDAEVKNNVRVI